MFLRNIHQLCWMIYDQSTNAANHALAQLLAKAADALSGTGNGLALYFGSLGQGRNQRKLGGGRKSGKTLFYHCSTFR